MPKLEPTAAIAPRLCRRKDVAAALSISEASVDRLRPRMPPGIVVNIAGSVRFSVAALDRWIEAGCHLAPPGADVPEDTAGSEP